MNQVDIVQDAVAQSKVNFREKITHEFTYGVNRTWNHHLQQFHRQLDESAENLNRIHVPGLNAIGNMKFTFAADPDKLPQ